MLKQEIITLANYLQSSNRKESLKETSRLFPSVPSVEDREENVYHADIENSK